MRNHGTSASCVRLSVAHCTALECILVSVVTWEYVRWFNVCALKRLCVKLFCWNVSLPLAALDLFWGFFVWYLSWRRFYLSDACSDLHSCCTSCFLTYFYGIRAEAGALHCTCRPSPCCYHQCRQHQCSTWCGGKRSAERQQNWREGKTAGQCGGSTRGKQSGPSENHPQNNLYQNSFCQQILWRESPFRQKNLLMHFRAHINSTGALSPQPPPNKRLETRRSTLRLFVPCFVVLLLCLDLFLNGV